jgi:amino acid transporter
MNCLRTLALGAWFIFDPHLDLTAQRLAEDTLLGHGTRMSDGLSGESEAASFSVGPALAALTYPSTPSFLRECAHPSRDRSPAVRPIAVIAAILSLGLSYMVSALSFYAAYVVGSHDRPSRKKEKPRLLAHLAFASPPLFTAIGVLCFLLHAPRTDYLIWGLAMDCSHPFRPAQR